MSDTRAELLSTRVVEAMAAARGVEPAALDFRLQDEIDADAIDALGAHEGTWSLDVRIDGQDVTIQSDGTVAVDGQIYRR